MTKEVILVLRLGNDSVRCYGYLFLFIFISSASLLEVYLHPSTALVYFCTYTCKGIHRFLPTPSVYFANCNSDGDHMHYYTPLIHFVTHDSVEVSLNLVCLIDFCHLYFCWRLPVFVYSSSLQNQHSNGVFNICLHFNFLPEALHAAIYIMFILTLVILKKIICSCLNLLFILDAKFHFVDVVPFLHLPYLKWSLLVVFVYF